MLDFGNNLDQYNLLNWNINGFYKHYEDLKILITEYKPNFICIQETRLNEFNLPILNNYNIEYKNIYDAHISSGGVLIAIKQQYEYEIIDINTSLQAIIIKVYNPIVFYLCTIYLPPQYDREIMKHFEELISKIPQPFLIVGDFNAKNPIWGDKNTDSRGDKLEKIIHDHDLVVLNNGEPTHIWHNGKTSCIDIALCSASVANIINFHTYDEPLSSDHIPILLNFNYMRGIDSKLPNWKLKDCNWDKFYVETSDINIDPNSNDNSYKQFCSQLINIANINCPKSKSTIKKPLPWFSKELRMKIKTRKKLYKSSRKSTDPNILTEYKRIKAEIQKLLRNARRDSFDKYISSINSETSLKEIWNKINIFNRKEVHNEVKTLKINGSMIDDTKEIANIFAQTFSNNSSDNYYNAEFLNFKTEVEHSFSLPQYSNTPDTLYNQPITMHELKRVINEVTGSSTGPDEIHYTFIKNVSEKGLEILLKIYNEIYDGFYFPDTWKTAWVKPICKPGKSNSDPNNYRPISRTSCLSKILERILNKRLVYFLEQNNILSQFQAGFRRGRTTNDNLIQLTNDIHYAFKNKQHLYAIFFDISKAYDQVWKVGILKELDKIGIRGKMLNFIANFLSDRKIQVYNGKHLSNPYEIKNGIPQGSVISVTLFLIYINSIFENIPHDVQPLMYADDLVVYYADHNEEIIQNKLSATLDNLEQWNKTYGLNFNSDKTKIVHFCKLRKPHDNIELKLYGYTIECVESYKFLGVIFDRKLNWEDNTRLIKTKCSKRLDIIKCVARKKWGIHRKTLMMMHNALIVSTLTYGIIVYGNLNNKSLKKLSSAYHNSIRLVTGAHRTSRIEYLLVESGQLPLSMICKKYTLNYGLKIVTYSDHPLFKLFKTALQIDNLHALDPLAKVFRNILDELNIQVPPLEINTSYDWNPQTPNGITIDQELTKFKKSQLTRTQLDKKIFQYKTYEQVFTDGSKSVNHTGLAVILPSVEIAFRLYEECSIFTAETIAILEGLKYLRIDNTNNKNVVIFSDSLSAIQAINNINIKQSKIIKEIIQEANDIKKEHNYNITICWIPSHLDIEGNDLADKFAKEASELNTEYKVPYLDIKNLVNFKIKEKWSDTWNTLENNKMYKIKNNVDKYTTVDRDTRKEEIILTRLRIGHTGITHNSIFKKEFPTKCDCCNVDLNVQHILVECTKYKHIREELKIDGKLEILLSDNESEVLKTLNFLDKINLSNEI